MGGEERERKDERKQRQDEERRKGGTERQNVSAMRSDADGSPASHDASWRPTTMPKPGYLGAGNLKIQVKFEQRNTVLLRGPLSRVSFSGVMSKSARSFLTIQYETLHMPSIRYQLSPDHSVDFPASLHFPVSASRTVLPSASSFINTCRTPCDAGR